MADDISEEDYERANYVPPETVKENQLLWYLLGVLHLVTEDEVVLPPDWREQLNGHEMDEDGALHLKAINAPASPQVEAILEADGDWLETTTGKAVKVTGHSSNGRCVTYVREETTGVWSEPEEHGPDCFLRRHVLAGGVPLL